MTSENVPSGGSANFNDLADAAAELQRELEDAFRACSVHDASSRTVRGKLASALERSKSLVKGLDQVAADQGGADRRPAVYEDAAGGAAGGGSGEPVEMLPEQAPELDTVAGQTESTEGTKKKRKGW